VNDLPHSATSHARCNQRLSQVFHCSTFFRHHQHFLAQTTANMIFDANETELLKQWVMKRLEGIEVDGDILADYVLALLTTDDPEPTLRSNSIENLQDFLQDGTDAFVNDLFIAIHSKAYDPSKAAPAPVPQAPQFDSRKRAFEDDGAQTGRIQSYEGGDRPVKQMRRGGGRGGFEARGGFDARGGRFAQPPMHQQQQWPAPHMPQVAQMPAPPPGMPPYDPNDPMSMFMAMQQAMGMQGMPGMPPMPGAAPAQKKTGRRCFDYDRKGFCARGASCPYEHGEDALVAPNTDQYDPSNSALPGFPPVYQFNDSGRGGARGRGRGRGGANFRGGGRRADISIQGQNFDRSNTTIVIEQIPEDKFDEPTVREFFNEFGNIEEVGLQPYKRLATVRYDSYDAAKAAYDSPKVIFDNRFVKVYWHKSDGPNKPSGFGGAGGQDVEMKEQEPQIDPEEFAKRQEEAQRKHDEALKQRAETERQRLDVDAKIKAMEVEKKKLADMLARKGGKIASPAVPTPSSNGGGTAQDDPKGLQEQLAKLEAEAQSLGIDPASTSNGWSDGSGYRGRGGFRGRGGYRVRGYNPGFRGGMRGGAVKRLDNRPRTVSIVFPSGSYDQHDEALRQYLLLSNNLEHAELSKHPERSDAALLAFEERYRAENFMAAAGASSGIPHIGSVDLSWQPNPPITITNGATGGEAQEDYKMDVSEPAAPAAESMDAFDVADDDDRW
jgi:RNA-binding protein 26